MKIAIISSAWDYTIDTPYNSPLGGSESSIVYFCEEMNSIGHSIYLFNKVEKVSSIRNILHIPIDKYPEYIKEQFDIVIVSNIVSDLFQFKLISSLPNTMFCLWTGHDIDQPATKLLKDKKARDYVDLFIFVSEWQRKRYLDEYGIEFKKTIIMRNGIGKPFEQYLNNPQNNKNHK